MKDAYLEVANRLNEARTVLLDAEELLNGERRRRQANDEPVADGVYGAHNTMFLHVNDALAAIDLATRERHPI